MGFLDVLHSIIRKSNGDISNFYIDKNNLYVKEFIYNIGWKDSAKLLENLDDNLFDVKIDDENIIYGIATPENGEILHFYFDTENTIRQNLLFSYDCEKYNLLYPYIRKHGSKLHLIYFIQSIYNEDICSLYSQYFDGNSWYSHNIDFVPSHFMINPFIASYASDEQHIFYIKNEEIYFCKFNPLEKSWSLPIQVTNTGNGKIYLSVLLDTFNLFHISWSEYIDENLVVRYTNGFFSKKTFESSEIINLSEPSNCSYPTLIKTKGVLWSMWVQLDKLYSCYSTDSGIMWSEPVIDRRSLDLDFIRYNFSSNNTKDLNAFKIDKTFGSFNPNISFMGFNKN